MVNNQPLLDMNKVSGTDLLCFSHLRWDFVYQRPQHLMSRFAKQFKTFFIEEPIFHNESDTNRIRLTLENVWVVTPLLNDSSQENLSIRNRQKNLLSLLFQRGLKSMTIKML